MYCLGTFIVSQRSLVLWIHGTQRVEGLLKEDYLILHLETFETFSNGGNHFRQTRSQCGVLECKRQI